MTIIIFILIIIISSSSSIMIISSSSSSIRPWNSPVERPQQRGRPQATGVRELGGTTCLRLLVYAQSAY